MPYLPETPKTYTKRKSRPHSNRKWKARSKAYLAKKVWCEMWLSLGRHVLAEATDHVVAAEDGGAFWLEENHMALSHFWHNKKSTLEQNRQIKLASKETPSGKIPLDRNEVIRVLTKRFEKDIKEWEEGQRS